MPHSNSDSRLVGHLELSWPGQSFLGSANHRSQVFLVFSFPFCEDVTSLGGPQQGERLLRAVPVFRLLSLGLPGVSGAVLADVPFLLASPTALRLGWGRGGLLQFSYSVS